MKNICTIRCAIIDFVSYCLLQSVSINACCTLALLSTICLIWLFSLRHAVGFIFLHLTGNGNGLLKGLSSKNLHVYVKNRNISKLSKLMCINVLLCVATQKDTNPAQLSAYTLFIIIKGFNNLMGVSVIHACSWKSDLFFQTCTHPFIHSLLIIIRLRLPQVGRRIALHLHTLFMY